MARYQAQGVMSNAPIRVSPYMTGQTAASGGAMTTLQAAASYLPGGRWTPRAISAVKTLALRWSRSPGDIVAVILSITKSTGLPMLKVLDLAVKRPVVSPAQYHASRARFGDAVTYILRLPGQSITANIRDDASGQLPSS